VSAQPPLSLGEAIDIALANNQSVTNAALQVEKAERDIQVARTRRLPTFTGRAEGNQLLTPVDVTFGRGVFGTYPGIGSVPGTDTTIRTDRELSTVVNTQVTQPLSQLFKINLNVHLNEAARDIKNEELRASRLALVDQVKRLYYAVLQTKSSLGAVNANASLLEELDRVMANRLAQKVVLKADVLDIQTRLAQAELSQLTLRNTLASQKEQLNYLLGRELSKPFDVVPVPEPTMTEADLAVARTQAIETRPDVKQARLRVQQAELAHGVAKADYIPDVSLAVSYVKPLSIDGAPSHVATAGVQVTWEPFDWGRRGAVVAARGLEIKQAQNAVADALGRATVEINSRFRDVETARARLRVASLSQESVSESARVKLVKYENNAVLLADVLQAQAAVADTNNQYQQALLGFWTAIADLEQALGHFR
jgi:outer membrane protein TolC